MVRLKVLKYGKTECYWRKNNSNKKTTISDFNDGYYHGNDLLVLQPIYTATVSDGNTANIECVILMIKEIA